MEQDPAIAAKTADPVEKPSTRMRFSEEALPPKFAGALATALRTLDALDASARETAGYLAGLKEDFRLLRRQAGQLVRQQGEDIAALESSIPK